MNKKLKKIEMTPRVSAQPKPKSTKKKLTPTTPPLEQWDERDIYFDDRGRMIVRNLALASRLEDTAAENGTITVILPPRPPIPVPPSPDGMCICMRVLFQQTASDPLREGGAAGMAALGRA
jgi:hypothetical protein